MQFHEYSYLFISFPKPGIFPHEKAEYVQKLISKLNESKLGKRLPIALKNKTSSNFISEELEYSFEQFFSATSAEIDKNKFLPKRKRNFRVCPKTSEYRKT
ncbi:hypothetical protein DQM68_02685 [Leptospira mayottensis]|uniref:Uncharacterized protein n=2 Tax=Leptospira mayottensis TaxID=1137606 RepID=A0AA87MQ49_9LEPT|nr:hypothetical protein DQM68_02685 [Leptospira mayottensis]AXR66062.1 hypothetical protein DQM28_06785 [Leptospira mayottensis]AZQ03622.1 hypothetical protein LEP1GSC190_01275 [Leptospira mayottensis 200901116]EKS00578.1 hypothetical protein LEP1GSC125_2673 [Leptospira mayottensis 200901122]TGN04364.1 hypothetical protein EHR03_10430 [Leptospira mayottensis]